MRSGIVLILLFTVLYFIFLCLDVVCFCIPALFPVRSRLAVTGFTLPKMVAFAAYAASPATETITGNNNPGHRFFGNHQSGIFQVNTQVLLGIEQLQH
jgi:hypothetical protein